MIYILYPLVTIAFLLAVFGVLAVASRPALVPLEQYTAAQATAVRQATQIAVLEAAVPTPTPCRSYYGTSWRGC